MICPKCKSKNVEVNGLYYLCRDCGQLDDSTFDMIMEVAETVANERMEGKK